MALATHDWFFAPDSTEHAITLLSEGRAVPISAEIEQMVLRRIVETKDCPICLSQAGQLCQVYGGISTLKRTHPLRLRLSRVERSALVAWALRKSGRRHEDGDEICVEPPLGEDVPA